VVGSSAADRVAIPFLRPEEEPTLDLQLTRMIARLAAPDRRQVAVVSTLPLAGALAFGGPGAAGLHRLSRHAGGFRPPPISVNDLAARGTELLDPAADRCAAAVHPRDLPPTAQYAIDQFLMAGAVPWCWLIRCRKPRRSGCRSRRRAAPPLDLGLFGRAGGCSSTSPGAGDRNLASRSRAPGRRSAAAAAASVWLTLGDQNRDTADPAFAGSARSRSARPASCGRSWAQPPASRRSCSPPTRAIRWTPTRSCRARIHRSSGPTIPQATNAWCLAARLQGHARSAFADQPPPGVAADGAAPQAEARDRRTRPGGDRRHDILDDRFWVARGQPGQPARAFAANGDFLLALLEELSGAQDLSALRNRAAGGRPFTRIAVIAARTAARSTRCRFCSIDSNPAQRAPHLAQFLPGADHLGAQILDRVTRRSAAPPALWAAAMFVLELGQPLGSAPPRCRAAVPRQRGRSPRSG